MIVKRQLVFVESDCTSLTIVSYNLIDQLKLILNTSQDGSLSSFQRPHSQARPDQGCARPCKAAAAPAPTPVSAPAPSVSGGLLSTVAEGFAFGTGSAIARHGVNAVVDSFSGSKDEPVPQPVAAAPIAPTTKSSAAVCASDSKAFLDCIDRNSNDVAACQFYLDALNQCKQQSVNL
ncbi:hypothetical protein PInf_017806 [Phytophthora infestans]|nr:hypothetical protein PInf_017806 [Phytophthora infestans]